MSLPDLLLEYEQLAAECRDLLETEISLLQSGQGGDQAAVHERKQALIGRLDELLGQLRLHRGSAEGKPHADKSQLNFLQQKFMQILRLDRELEKLLLKEGAADLRPSPSRSASAGYAAQRYKQSGTPARGEE